MKYAFEEVTQLGPYRILERIGSGAMGEVYRAEHIALGRPVAIKTPRGDVADTTDYAERLYAEAQVCDLIGDEHVVQILDLACEPDGRTWFAMELLQGTSLATLCSDKVEPRRSLEIAHQVAEALVPVHTAGVVHRDVKPENIYLVERNGRELVKLLDFGIALLPGQATPRDRSGALEIVLGTPPYMPPEQIFGEKVDHRADLYALGAVLFELLTGRAIFDRPSTNELLAAIVLAQAPVPSDFVALPESIRGDVDHLVARCLAKKPAHRPQSAGEIAEELAAIIIRLDAERARKAQPKPMARSKSAWVSLTAMLTS